MLLNTVRRRTPTMLASLLAAASLYTGVLLADTQQSGVIGYIDQSRFHPLVVATPKTVTQADSTKLVLRGKLRNAFEATSERLSIKKQEDYVDAFGPDTPGRYALVQEKVSSVGDFYTPQPHAFPSLSRDSYSKEIKNFYSFFSRDKWGQHFIARELLDKPIDEIARKTNVRIHIVTDLNHNSLPELWITYKLMYGEIGRMVYEQTGDRIGWREVANHCYMCD